MHRSLIVVVTLLAWASLADAQIPPSVGFRVPKAPTVARGDSGAFLSYELHVTNFAATPMALKRVDVSDATDSARVLLTLSDSTLLRAIARPGATMLPSERPNISGGTHAVLYLWIPLGAAASPATLVHRLTLQVMRMDTATKRFVPDTVMHRLAGASTRVAGNAVRISPPLRGEWLAANGPSNASGHRRTAMALNGTVTIPQRFAIDFLQIDSAGNTFRGDRSKNANFLAHGQEALAVADGRVVATKDSIPENTGGPTSRAVPINLETVGGNHVVIEIGPEQFTFYAHLQPGSLRVRVGDRVKRGQVIGLVGNSGNSTEPHLHFHLSDALAAGTTTLGSEGIPYALPTIDILGHCQLGQTMRCTRGATTTVKDAMPLQNQLVRFPR